MPLPIKIHASAANVQSQDKLSASAGRGLHVLAGESSSSMDQGRYHRSSGFLSSSESRDKGSETWAQASSFGGQSVQLQAGNNIVVQGSDVVSDTGTTLVAKNDVSILAAQTRQTGASYSASSKSGLMGSGGIGFTIGSKEESLDQQNTSTGSRKSTIGSVNGNVSIVAGKAYRQEGSDIVTPGGDSTVVAQNVQITEARNSSLTQTEQKQRQSGLTVTLSNAVIDAVQSAQKVGQAIGNTGDARMQALGAASIALSARNTINSLNSLNNVTNGTGELAATQASAINVSISVGGSKSKSQSNSSEASNTGQVHGLGGLSVTLKSGSLCR